MLKIGQFVQLGQVTIKTLRHYDEIGLLNPARTDPATGYRFYSIEQLPRLHRIMALKEMGLSLEQIGLMLEDDLPVDEIRGMLGLRKNELHQQMREARRQLSVIEFRLRMIEAETNFPELEVAIKPLQPFRCLSLFIQRQPEILRAHRMDNLVDSIRRAVDEGVIHYTGVTYDVFHGETVISLDSPEVANGQHEIWLGVAESQEDVFLDGIGRLTIRDQPPVAAAATLMLVGQDMRDQNFEKVALLRRWAVAHGYGP
jgi:DNA-binding transcriptional MerR regulator